MLGGFFTHDIVPKNDIRHTKMLQPKHTMNGLHVHDEMRTNGSTHNRVLRILLKSNLTLLQSHLQNGIAVSFGKELASGTLDSQG